MIIHIAFVIGYLFIGVQSKELPIDNISNSIREEVLLKNDSKSYVVNGEVAPPGEVPYQASLRNPANRCFCGGTIISNRWILTAAHCTKGLPPKHITVVVGSNDLLKGGDSYSVESIINHENYTNVYNGYDISLLKVSSDIAFNDFVKALPLPEEDTAADVNLRASGWGWLSAERVRTTDLQMVVLRSMTNDLCQKQFGINHTIFDSQICTHTQNGQGTCKGDSGGPLYDGKSVVGVVSWGAPCAIGYPDVFTRVFKFKDWIQGKMATNIPESVREEVLPKNDTTSYIVKGEVVPPGEIPYQASLRTKANVCFCGGTILSKRWILTAAHCPEGLSPDNITVVVGSNDLLTGGDRYSVESIVTHENYTDLFLGYDISLIKVSSDIVFSDFVKTIPLPEERTGAGVRLRASGWGWLSQKGVRPNDLQMVVLTSMANDECQKRVHGNNTIFDSQICTDTQQGQGVCSGDSGGPLFDGISVVGIVSWGRICATGAPDVFTRVYDFKEWIQGKMVN